MNPDVSVVTPTYRRPGEVKDLLENLANQTLLPREVILVDGAPPEEDATERVVRSAEGGLPFKCRYVRHERGTAIQRNRGIDLAEGDLIALVDDDVRLEPRFLEVLAATFKKDIAKSVGGVVGFRTNHFVNPETTQRWRWYKRLRLLKTFEPSRYDYLSGYPINALMQRPFSGVRRVDFMTTACAMWRREVFDSGLRFDPFFRDYGVLEDAHLSLRASRDWVLLQCGDAHCQELSSPNGRVNSRKLGYKCVVNYYYVFQDVARPLTRRQKVRFWRFQLFELFRMATSVVRRRRKADLMEIGGRIEGFIGIAFGRVKGLRP